ncbi:olfactory receptor 52K1-like [Bufo gargarizans]|uniref:olfactory receptor 52K1-like n=1 Tax=Bufo gargarizans TaxID=30331 RepID=UPI001CF3FB55|nr:olfactory receptor 52K1-like [Bufo gargarizans]
MLRPMLLLNTSSHMPSFFFLIGIPGLEDLSILTSISFCLLYILAVLGNSSMSYIICTEKTLHGPMYFFLAMLALNDLAFTSSTVPKMLKIFWGNDGLIDASSCLTQMFFVHFLAVMESGILTAMAYDRYIAICSPLRYTSILTFAVLEKIATVILVRAFVTIFPIPVLVSRLHYCGGYVVLHSYCDHMAVVNVACGDTRVNSIYGLVLSLSVTGFDLLFIGLSYTMILGAIFRLPSRAARHKAIGTCTSHICVIMAAYLPGIFTFVSYRFGQKTIPHNVHIFLANIYILFPAFLNPIIYGVKTKQIRDCVLKKLQVNQKLL